MKKLLCFLFIFLTFNGFAYSAENAANTDILVQNVEVYSEKNNFGLKFKNGENITKSEFNKLIAVGDTSYICRKNGRFGLIGNKGKYIIKPRFRHAERLFDKFVKLGNDTDFGIYDKTGKIIVPPEYSSIEPLFGRMFVTCKNYKYGLTSFDGNVILENKLDDIYMPNPKILRLQYQGNWYEIERTDKKALALPDGITKDEIQKEDYTITDMVENTGVLSSYSIVTGTDYALKILSSISPAYEETIDELMFSQGADSVNIIMKLSWIPRFPFTYAVKYYNNFKAPNNGPLANIKTSLKRKIK